MNDTQASPKAISYLIDLVTTVRGQESADLARIWASTATAAQISEQIDRMKVEKANTSIAKAIQHEIDFAELSRDALMTTFEPGRVSPVEIEIGMYRKSNGAMYRVYPARNGGHLLAKRLIDNGDGGWSFEYAGAAIRFVSAGDRMTLEEAKAWGAQLGTCCVCAALLTDPTSVAAGIGPICKDKI